MKKKTIGFISVLVLAFFLQGYAAFASEVTGNLSTGIGATVGNTLNATVTPPPSSGGSGGGGGGGGGSSHGPNSRSSGGASSSTASPSTPVVSPTVSTGQVLGASTHHFVFDLTVGSTGDDVQSLQNMLIAAGYLNAGNAIGYFGPLTKAAVMKYQTAHSINPTGYVGPLTRNALDGSVTTVPTNTQDIASVIAGLMAQIEVLQARLAALKAQDSTVQ